MFCEMSVPSSDVQDFPNEEEDYAGPELLCTSSLRSADHSQLCFLLVKEEKTLHHVCAVDGVPVSSAELMQLFE